MRERERERDSIICLVKADGRISMRNKWSKCNIGNRELEGGKEDNLRISGNWPRDLNKRTT